MASKSTAPKEESGYATEAGQTGKPVGPEHDASFSAPDFYDPATGKRIETPWDSEQQKADPGFDAEVMSGTTEAYVDPNAGSSS